MIGRKVMYNSNRPPRSFSFDNLPFTAPCVMTFSVSITGADVSTEELQLEAAFAQLCASGKAMSASDDEISKYIDLTSRKVSVSAVEEQEFIFISKSRIPCFETVFRAW